MKNFIRLFSLIAIISTSSSCALMEKFKSKKPAEPLDYLENAAKFDFKKFFTGDVEAFAIKQGEDGKIIGTSTIKISGKWDENKGVVQQNFLFNDGSKDSRTWLVTINQDGTFDAVGHDVATAAAGKQIGNAAQSKYSLMISQKAGRQEVFFDDRMYQIDEKSMIIISNFKNKNPSKESADKTSSGKTIISLKKIDK